MKISEGNVEPKFIHLNVHSEFSLVDGIIRIKPLMAHCVAENIQSVALTDFSNFFAAVKFYKAATAHGIKPIFGSELLIENEQSLCQRAIFLCMNNEGYANLTQLISMAYTLGQKQGEPRIDFSWLQEKHEGLICLLSSTEGYLATELLKESSKTAKNTLRQWNTLFKNRLYIELSRVKQAYEQAIIDNILPLAAALQIPVVATNKVRFLSEGDFNAHEARVCIREGYVLDDANRPQRYTKEQFFKSEAQMVSLFEDIPSALLNSVEIAKRCNVNLDLNRVSLPNFPTPDGISIEEYLSKASKQGLEERLQDLFPHEFSKNRSDFQKLRKPYDERLQVELDVINSMGFPGYFLIVADFIQWAKNHGIPVGPGRGSGAGSLVAYALKITDLDPLAYDLLFERFLNPERISMPDFDIDFCMEGRDRVIEYVANTYGRESVSQIITFGTMAAKAVVRDVGRVLGFPYGFVDKIAKLIPFEVGMTLEKALQQEEKLRKRYEEEEEVGTLLNLAKKLEGVARNAGKHAGGVVIAPSKLTDFAALYCEQGSEQVVTQFDKDDVEAVGLVKFDFLGLRTLTIVDWCLQVINAARAAKKESPIDITKIPLDDEATFKLLKSNQTTGVFQLESRGMKDLIKRLQPDCFEDIIALVALFRPGPLQSGMVDDFIDRKHGRLEIAYPHPDLEAVLKPTYGVILYQEQVMQIAQVLAGFTLGGADMLRRAMGKKKPEEMAKQRALFLQGTKAKGIDAQVAESIFDLMEKFAGYGFNKSHSAAYALVSYQTAWLKTHYPAEFMAAVLSSEMDHTDKIVVFIEECYRMNLTIQAPNINQSQYSFTSLNKDTIIYGLGAIKGAGESAIEAMLHERQANGDYKDLFNLCARVEPKKLNKRILEALISAGAFDVFEQERSTMYASIESALKFSQKKASDNASGQADLFAILPADECSTHEYVKVPPWSDERRLQGEKESLGLYFSGHPLDVYQNEIKHFISGSMADLDMKDGKTITVAGLITSVRILFTKRGDRMAFLSLSDSQGHLEAAVFSDILEHEREQLVKDNIIIMEAVSQFDGNSGTFKLSAKRILSIEQARLLYAKTLLLKINKSLVTPKLVDSIQTILRPHAHGHCPVAISYKNDTAKAMMHLDNQWWVEPTDSLLKELRHLLGCASVTVCY